MSPQKPHPVRLVQKRHRWLPMFGFNDRDECRICEWVRLHTVGSRSPRYEYRTRAFAFVANRKQRDPAPPCPGPSTQKDTEP